MTDNPDTSPALLETARQKLSVARADLEEAEAQVKDARARVEKYENVLEFIEEHTGNGEISISSDEPETPFGELVEEKPLDKPSVTIREGAEVVLRHARKPLKNRRIAERMIEAGFRYDRGISKLRDSVGTTLNRAVSDGDTFKKHGPGTFGLKEWENGGGDGGE